MLENWFIVKSNTFDEESCRLQNFYCLSGGASLQQVWGNRHHQSGWSWQMVWVWHILPRVYQTNLMKQEKKNKHEHKRNLWEMDNLLPSPFPTMELDTFFLLTCSISGFFNLTVESTRITISIWNISSVTSYIINLYLYCVQTKTLNSNLW